MMSRISWEQLSFFLTVALFLYYIVVVFVFYRKDLLATFKAGSSGKSKPEPYLAQTDSSPALHTSDSDKVVYNQVLELLQDCKPVFQAAADQSLEKEQVLEALQLRVQKYPQIIGTAFQVAVSNHIDQEVQARCSFSLEESDIEKLWR